MPVLVNQPGSFASSAEFANEREILYKLFFDMKRDVTELKKMFLEVMQHGGAQVQMPGGFFNDAILPDHKQMELNQPVHSSSSVSSSSASPHVILGGNGDIQENVVVEESLNIMEKEKELIIKALKKHKSKRRDAALDLGISERTLYRKLKEYDIEEL